MYLLQDLMPSLFRPMEVNALTALNISPTPQSLTFPSTPALLLFHSTTIIMPLPPHHPSNKSVSMSQSEKSRPLGQNRRRSEAARKKNNKLLTKFLAAKAKEAERPRKLKKTRKLKKVKNSQRVRPPRKSKRRQKIQRPRQTRLSLYLQLQLLP